jgi:hypothetical protein
MAESQEGRAFTGAVELLRDDRLLKELRDDLGTILQHSFAQALTPLEAGGASRVASKCCRADYDLVG